VLKKTGHCDRKKVNLNRCKQTFSTKEHYSTETVKLLRYSSHHHREWKDSRSPTNLPNESQN